MTDPTTAYGWTAQPRKVEALLATRKDVKPPAPVSVEEMPLPASPLAKAIREYAEKELALETFNHSMRVYYYGIAIAQCSFPTWLNASPLPSASPPSPASFAETYFLTCLLHDIGTTDANMAATRMSFEFYGGIVALDVLARSGGGAPRAQAESVAEAVFRHQDLGDAGRLTTVGALVQLATIFDNMTPPILEELVHKETIESVVRAYPRKKWSSCFARTIRKENGLKPWAHTTVLGEEEFPNGVLNNVVMAPYD